MLRMLIPCRQACSWHKRNEPHFGSHPNTAHPGDGTQVKGQGQMWLENNMKWNSTEQQNKNSFG